MDKIISLKKNTDFTRVLTKGRRFLGRYLVLYVKENHLNLNRLGIAISKKIRKSVVRNRIKRLIRESYRLSKEDMKKGYDIVIIWKNINSDVLFKEVFGDLQKVLKKSGLIKNGE